MKKVILTGRLAKEFGKTFSLDVQSPAEAVRALCYQLPGFEATLKSGHYRVTRLGKNDVDIDVDSICINFGNATGLKISPVVIGAKNKGLGKVILGVALIGAAFFFAPAAGLSASLVGNVTYGYLAQTGALMALGGVSAMLTPQNISSSDSTNKSYFLDSTGNATQQGSAIPVVYGEVYTGSVVVSAGVTAEELTY